MLIDGDLNDASKSRAMLFLAATAAAAAASSPTTIAWATSPPGRPINISVSVSPHSAEVRWLHAVDESDLPSHYVVK